MNINGKDHDDFIKFIEDLTEEEQGLVTECFNRIAAMLNEYGVPAVYAITLSFLKINDMVTKQMMEVNN